MKYFLLLVLMCMVVAGAAGVWYYKKPSDIVAPEAFIIARPLDQYTIDALSQRGGKASDIALGAPIATESSYRVYPFHFGTSNKRASGLAHIPNDASATSKKPVVIQFRGYVERSIYAPGVGTQRSAAYFAQNGFISLAPDFLGYGTSDNPSRDVFEERFQSYTTALDLIASVGSLDIADKDAINLWGHSNGGQIALTILEITKAPYPTVLWAPVTQSFPYSILYYTNEADDRGKALRKKLAEFERLYDTDLYALVNYVDRIEAPIQLHQGGLDDAVPQEWSDTFVDSLKKAGKSVEYFVYPGADHNLQPNWTTVVARDVEFFRSKSP